MNDLQLEHHGIRGMHWGFRKVSASQISKAKKHVDSASDVVKEGKNINSSISNIRSTSKSKDLSSMSDSALREKINRMSMEQQYASLSSNQTSKGQTYAKNILEVGGSALAIGSSALGIALAIKQLKG